MAMVFRKILGAVAIALTTTALVVCDGGGDEPVNTAHTATAGSINGQFNPSLTFSLASQVSYAETLNVSTIVVVQAPSGGVGFASLTESIDTTTPAGKLLFHVFAVLAEFERNLIRERTMAGLKAARARGKSSGRPSKLTGKKLALAKSLMADRSNQVGDLAQRFGVSRSTLYRLTK